MKIMIDAGHGGHDPGASANGIVEKDYALRLAKAVKNNADAAGLKGKIRLTRSTDNFISLSRRADLANDWGADYFLSYHLNAGGGTGLEAYSYTTVPNATDKRNKKYYDRFLKPLDFRDRGYKRANFAVLRETLMSAMIVENLFVDHPVDAEFLKSRSGFNQLVDAHTAAILDISSVHSDTPSANLSNFHVLSDGSEGNDVRIAQTILYGFGFNPGTVDGFFGPNTVKALKDFQSSNIIVVDGFLGSQSLGVMINTSP